MKTIFQFLLHVHHIIILMAAFGTKNFHSWFSEKKSSQFLLENLLLKKVCFEKLFILFSSSKTSSWRDNQLFEFFACFSWTKLFGKIIWTQSTSSFAWAWWGEHSGNCSFRYYLYILFRITHPTRQFGALSKRDFVLLFIVYAVLLFYTAFWLDFYRVNSGKTQQYNQPVKKVQCKKCVCFFQHVY